MNKPGAYTIYLLQEAAASFLFSMVFTASAIYQVSVVGLTPLQLVLVGTTLELAIFIFEVPTGVVADVFSRKLSIIIGWLLVGLGFLVEGSFPWFVPILMAQLIWGIGYTFTSGATQAWITDEIGEALVGKAFIRAGQWAMIAALLGTAAGMALGASRVNIPIQAGGAGLILLGVLLIFLMPETNFHPVEPGNRHSWKTMSTTFLKGLNLVQSRPGLMRILAIGFFYGLYSEGFDRLWTKHILDNIGLPANPELQPVVWIGLLRSAGMLLTVAAMEVAHRKILTENISNVVRALLLLSLVLFLGLLGFAAGNTFWLVVGFYWMISISRQVIGPVYTAWVNQRLDSSVRATVLSMSGQVDAIGQIIGGPGVGLIGNLSSVRTALMTSGAILSPIFALYRLALKEDKNQVEE